MVANAEPELTLKIEAGHPGNGSFTIRVSPQYVDELRGLLHEAGLLSSNVMEFSEGSVLGILEVYIREGALPTTIALTSAYLAKQLNPVVTTFLDRNKDKRVHVVGGGVEIDIKGHSPRAAERILERVVEQQQDYDAKWKQLRGSGDATNS
ncbi:hypothetical protein [Prauserella endophytica]|uniref:Uncharacterized protein n=1 Tax=Prauserella endophytica TaxID=1592324 RepID=A0ABY2RUZ0_9PSEU|nr:hypothetical protein [Prauserella endophytica]TKG61539.1 hypothetical protein FCN18_33410 [Prauserella endophytica]